MLFKEVWQFSSPGGGPWNEVYYESSGTLAEAASFNEAFRVSRLALLAEQCTWKKVRVSGVLDPSLHTLVNINRQGTREGSMANAAEAAVCTLASSVQPGSRKLWMRGLVENSVARSVTTGIGLASPSFLTDLSAFIERLARAGYVVLSKKKGIGNGIVKTRVTTVTPNVATGVSVLTTAAAHLLAPNDLVTLMSMDEKQFPGLNGTWKADVLTGTTFSIPYLPALGVEPAAKKGFAQKLAYWETATIDPKISGFSYLGSRQTKNPDTGSRGARRARRRRSLA